MSSDFRRFVEIDFPLESEDNKAHLIDKLLSPLTVMILLNFLRKMKY